MTFGDVILLAPLPFAAWASTPAARVLIPGFLTWFYRYLVVHVFLLAIVAQVHPSAIGAIGYFAASVVCIYFVMYDYFNANKPDDPPLGIKMMAVLSVTWESFSDRWGLKRSGGALERGAPADLASAGDINLGLAGTLTPSMGVRGKLWLHELMFKSQENALAAQRKTLEEAAANLRAQEKFAVEAERARHLRAKPVIAERVRDEFKAEVEERTISQRERDQRSADEHRKAKEAQAKRKSAIAQIEFDKRRREVRLLGEEKPKETAEEQFRREAEQILKFGVTGRFGPIAEQCRVALIAERGGVEHLTEDDKERLELIFALAQRQEESKS